ncbi:type I-E CRISPR-associated protein Cas6/Cse3/CasE [Anaerococcus sp. AGMB09787]|uniref:type I-E CRISPR-associated protein Cas6/Cse3/CasE n=1 Tax=Anaerococcus sp. AGMB09787 TaxID=2922869 RepID=UPI001FAFD74E|nr:type I-E CRISPR-associated protein Cas6/Cse3/CasE [Anaerococcus sp. AGMB09787]
MYISRTEIDLSDRKNLKNLSHLGAYHSLVEDSFPEDKGEPRKRKLWRLDKLGGKTYLVVVSEDKPDLEILGKYSKDGIAQSKSYDAYLASIKEGEKYFFRVTLNPVIARKEDKARGRVYPLLNTKDQEDFFLARSEKNGFSLDACDFKIVERSFAPLKKEGKKLVNLNKVTYEGILTVKDKETFYKTLTQGFGKKKAYGCGLLTVIKA